MENDAEIRADVRECVAACQHHQKRVCTKTVWSVPACVPQNIRMERSVVHGAQPNTVQEIQKRGKRVMTYSEMCESRMNKRRTLSERVIEQQTATTLSYPYPYSFRDPRHAHVGGFFFFFFSSSCHAIARSRSPFESPTSFAPAILYCTTVHAGR